MVLVKFRLAVEDGAEDEDDVYIVGNCDELGQWNQENGIKLIRHDQSEESSDRHSHWYITLEIGSTKKLEYRYFLGRTMCELPSSTEDKSCTLMTVQWWEGGPTPRQVDLADESNVQLNDSFGIIGNKSVKYPGWLTGQKEIRLVIDNNSFKMVDKKAQSLLDYRIKCLPLNASQEDHDPHLIRNKMLYLDLSEEMTEYKSQPEFGVSVKQDSVITFRVQTVSDCDLFIHIFIYQELPGVDNDLPLVGHSVVLAANLFSSSRGALQIPVHGNKLRMCGQITLDYLVVKPLPSYTCTMSTSDALEWRNSHRLQYVGHRGMGMCRAGKHIYNENTIQSFSEAAVHGADFVEFDVQLTKDLVPVIFHDFNCRLSCNSFSGAQQSSHDVAVLSLTYDQLKKLKIGFSEEGTGNSVLYENDKPKQGDDNHLFPTVLEAFNTVTPQLGFNIEVKYPMKLESGELEDGVQTFMDMNKYLDVLLENILLHAGERNIVLTSFNTDVCIMLRLKQNRYPVSFLTQGMTERYLLYKDRRTHDIPKVICLAKAEHFLGVNPITEYVLRDPTLVQKARDLDLILIPWGDKNHDQNIEKQLKERGVHAIICDNIHEVIKPEKSINNNF